LEKSSRGVIKIIVPDDLKTNQLTETLVMNFIGNQHDAC
jgi:hypothetical protein